MNWLSTVAETSGHPTGGLVLLSVERIAAIGEDISKIMPIYKRGLKLVKSEKVGYCLAVGAMQHRFGPSAISQFRKIAGECSLGFDIGASIHAGQIVATAPENLTDPSALAGFFLTHGIVGSPSCIEVLKVAVRQPEYRIGVAVAVRSIHNDKKRYVDRVIETLLMI